MCVKKYNGKFLKFVKFIRDKLRSCNIIWKLEQKPLCLKNGLFKTYFKYLKVINYYI